jgi:cytochrome d ubiquinol oxidase subunit II
MFDYATLRVIWWLLLGLLLIGFAILDGYDLGTAMLIPFVGRNDAERRVVINTISPYWEGNQVWFILGGGAIFAAWPILYAVSFSGFYLAMFVLLCTFIIRPVGFKYRSKMPQAIWRNTCDWLLSGAAFVGALIFGVAVGNVIQGVPFHLDPDLRVFYTGTFWQLLNPFALLCGLLSVSMIIMQGGYYLATKTEAPLRNRALIAARFMSLIVVLLFALGGYWVSDMNGYNVITSLGSDGPSNPLQKVVEVQAGVWLKNYVALPWTLSAPLMGFTGAILAMLFSGFLRSKLSLLLSSLSIFGIISTVGLSLFPFLLPSSSDPKSSLLVWDASSSRPTLQIMLAATVIFLPIIIAYTTWVIRVMRGTITVEKIQQDDKTFY